MNWWYHKEEWDQVSVKENELKFEFSEAEDPSGHPFRDILWATVLYND